MISFLPSSSISLGETLNNYSQLVDMLIKAEMEGSPKHEHVASLCQTPEYLVTHANFPNLDIAITGRVIGKAHFDHGITKSIIKNLPNILSAPRCLFRSANPDQSDSVVVLTFETKCGSPIIVPIRQNQQIGRSHYYNIVTSIYGKEGPDPEEKWKTAGLLLWQS